MADAKRLNANDLEVEEFAMTLGSLASDLHVAVDWVDDAFGEIERGAARLAPLALARVAKDALRAAGLRSGLFLRKRRANFFQLDAGSS